MEGFKVIKNNTIQEELSKIKNMINNKEPLDTILSRMFEYFLHKITLDLPNVDVSKRKEVVQYMIEYVLEAINKQYFNQQNIYDRLNTLISINEVKIENMKSIYGRMSTNNKILSINFGLCHTSKILRHTIFHELTHALTNNCWKVTENNIYKTNEQENTVLGISKSYTPIIGQGLTEFLKEVIAEATACDLANSYIPRQNVRPGITTDWFAHYNKSYQQLGFEFLKTLLQEYKGQSDRELFKVFSMDAMDSKNFIPDNILRVYKDKNPIGYKDDLFKLNKIFYNLVSNHTLTNNIVSNSRDIMDKYTNGFKIKR